MSPSHHHRHGSILVGRIFVAVACLLVLGANLMICKAATSPQFPVPAYVKARLLAGLVWLFAGALAMCMRRGWGRYMALFFVYVETFDFFLSGIVAFNSAEIVPPGMIKAYFIGTAVYLYVALVLTHSKHVQRLTSRAYE